MIRPHPDQSLAARKGTLPGKLQDVLTPAGWGRKKLELATWGRCGLERWGQEHLAETPARAAWASMPCRCTSRALATANGPVPPASLRGSPATPRRAASHAMVTASTGFPAAS